MIPILKLSTDLLSRSILEVPRKINTMPIVCNAQRLVEGVHRICSAGVSAALLQMPAALKKNDCSDSTTAVDAPVLCLCQIPLWFLKVPNWELTLAWEKNRSSEEIPLTFESFADFPKVSYCKE